VRSAKCRLHVQEVLAVQEVAGEADEGPQPLPRYPSTSTLILTPNADELTKKCASFVSYGYEQMDKRLDFAKFLFHLKNDGPKTQLMYYLAFL